MRRILITTLTSSLLAIALPSVAAAEHHGKRHHGAHHTSTHKRHAATARVLHFGAALTPAPTSGAPATPSTPSTPSGETAGTVASFSNGVLTITLNGGSKSTVSGQVTQATELECLVAPTTTGGEDESGGDDESGSQGGEQDDSSAEGPSGSQHHGDGQQGAGDGQDNEGGEGDHEGSQPTCTTAALVVGAVVREAELSISSAGAVWDKVVLQ
jgi:hypothetical protein